MRNLIFCIILVMETTCTNSNKYDEVMTENSMINYLTALHIAEASIQELKLPKDSSRAMFTVYEKNLLEKNGVTDSLFIRSYNYYLQNPVELEKIYEAVVDSISIRKSMKYKVD